MLPQYDQNGMLTDENQNLHHKPPLDTVDDGRLNNVRRIADGWVIDINNAISGSGSNSIRKRDVKLNLKLQDVNLEKPVRFILKAIPLSENSCEFSPKEHIDLTSGSGRVQRDKNLIFDSCSQSSLSSQGICGLQALIDSNKEVSSSMRNLSKFAKLEDQKNNVVGDETFSEKTYDHARAR